MILLKIDVMCKVTGCSMLHARVVSNNVSQAAANFLCDVTMSSVKICILIN